MTNKEMKGQTVTKMIKGQEVTGTYIDANTIYVHGIGTVSSVGELDLKNLIKDLMGLPSFWRQVIFFMPFFIDTYNSISVEV